MAKKPEKAAPVTRTTVRLSATGFVLRHRCVIAWPDKFGTDPMAVGAINKRTMTPPRKAGGIP